MGQRTRILTEILGFDGWKVKERFFESSSGKRVEAVRGFAVLRETRLVLVVERRWLPRCSQCGAACRGIHEHLPARRWADLSWAGHPVDIEYAGCRVKCRRCGSRPVEMVAWADPYQRQTRRLQHHLAVQAASMPVMHVAALHGLSWLTVRRAEELAIERWEATRPAVPLRHVGVDEKWLGRRHNLEHKFVTVVSNLETGEPVWIGRGRSEDTLRRWLESLPREQKAGIQLFAMDLHRPYWNAVDNTRGLEQAPIVHDPFHVMKLAGKMLDELRREVFFRAGPELRAVGKGKRWLLLRAWEHVSDENRIALREMLGRNRTLARGYQIKEELRELLLCAPDRPAMEKGLDRILRRTRRYEPRALRRLHDTLNERYNEIVALAEHRPATGRLEALNNNWEALVRRARGYRNHQYLLRKLRFMVANPIRSNDGVRRFLALGLTPPMPRRHAA
jgi:transposase